MHHNQGYQETISMAFTGKHLTVYHIKALASFVIYVHHYTLKSALTLSHPYISMDALKAQYHLEDTSLFDD